MSYASVVQADSPSWYSRMDDASGTTCTALVGSNGTYLNAPTLGVAGCTTDGDTAVKFATASSQRMHAPTTPLVDTFTLEMWVKRTTLNASINALVQIGWNNAFMYINTPNTIVIAKAGVSNLGETTATIADTTQFHHLVWTKNGATSHVYLDAVDVTPTISNVTFSHDSAETNNHFASNDLENAFFANCTLDEIALYPSALTSAQVTTHYNTAITPLSNPGRQTSPGQLVAALAHARNEERKSDRSGGQTDRQSVHRARRDYLRRKERG